MTAAPSAIPTDVYGLPTGGLNYGAGYGWLPYYNQANQNLAQLYGIQGGLGNSLLNTLFGFEQNPASGPLGLAAFGHFGGGAQNVAAGTGGAGIPNPYGGLLDRLLTGLSQSVMNPGSPFNPDNNGQYNTDAAKPSTPQIDPNKAPAMTPTEAAKAPNEAENWIKAWQAFNPGKTYGVDQGGTQYHAAAGGGIPLAPAMVSPGDGFLGRIMPGSLAPLAPVAPAAAAMNAAPAAAPAIPTSVPAPVSIPSGEGVKPIAPAVSAPPKLDFHTSPIESLQALASHPDKEAILADAAKRFRAQGGKVADFWRSMRERGLVPQSVTQRAPDNGMTIGGQQHFITDAQGNRVAALTEDGKPEHVGGIGGVEVTPLDPVRRAQYEARKGLPAIPGIPKMATGGSALFPAIPDSKVNTGPESSDLIPSFGGPSQTRADQVGSTFQSSYNPATGAFELPSEATDSTTTNDAAGYAKLFGGALGAGNTAVNSDTIRELSAGKAPSKLLTSQEFRTLLPSQRQGYLALLQSMGLGTAADIMDQIQKFTPDSMQ